MQKDGIIYIYMYMSVYQNKVLIRQKKITASEEKYAEDKNRLFINEKEQMAIFKQYCTSLMIKEI